MPLRAWTPAYDSDRQVRDGAWVAELTGMLNLTAWPKGMRLIVRKERPHPGAQLRLTDIDGHRLTCFATNTRGGQLADLELRHRRRARCEDRIRCTLCRHRHNVHYPETVVMPAPVLPALVGGGDRAAGIGIITGPAGRPVADRVAGIFPAVRLAAWSGLGLAA